MSISGDHVRIASKIISEHFASFGLAPCQGGFWENGISSRQLNCSICHCKQNVRHFSAWEPPSQSLPAWTSDASDMSNSTVSATMMSPFPDASRILNTSQEDSKWHFLTKLMESWLVFRRNRMVFYRGAKRDHWSFTWLSKSPFAKCFSIWQEVLNECFADSCSIPWNLPTNFHPNLIATVRHRCLLLLCALLFLSNTSCFRSVRCRRTMIPWKIFTGFAKFQRIVSVNDFRLPILLQELLQALLCFLRSFLFLHGYDCIHCVAKSCTTTAYRWLFRDSHPSPRTFWSAVI